MKHWLRRHVAAQQRPAPLKYYFFAVMFLLLGVLGHVHDRHQVAQRRLQDPQPVAVAFVDARCQGPAPRSTEGMHRSYVYVVARGGGRPQPYRIADQLWYASESACKADLPQAGTIQPRTQAWYDAAAPWNARWTLEEPSSISAGVWVAAAIAVCLLGLGWREQGRRRR